MNLPSRLPLVSVEPSLVLSRPIPPAILQMMSHIAGCDIDEDFDLPPFYAQGSCDGPGPVHERTLAERMAIQRMLKNETNN